MPREKKFEPGKTRAYNSAVRKQQAEDTRNRIAEAAEELIKLFGYEHTTIEAIARKAGVAPQTVYAVFQSKQGILIHLIKRGHSHEEIDYQALFRKASLEEAAGEMARQLSRQGRAHASILNTLGGFETLWPELAALVDAAHAYRRTQILRGIQGVFPARSLTLQEKALTDILWVVTDDHLYHKLVTRAGWTSEQYELFTGRLLELIVRDVIPEMLQAFGVAPSMTQNDPPP